MDESNGADVPSPNNDSDDVDHDPAARARAGLALRRLLAIGASLAVVLALIAGFVLTRDKDDPKPVPDTTTSTTKRSTTTTTRKLPPDTSEVATVKASVDRLAVRSEPPESWSTAKVKVVPTGVADPPPSSQQSAPDKEPIPTIKSPVTGRYAVKGGWEFTNPGPYTPRQPFTLLVLERRGDWLKVLLPVRPNETAGYISVDDVELSTTRKRIEIRVSEHSLRAFDGSTVVVDSPIVTGVSFSPTPTGTFSLTDVVPYKNVDGDYGPFALATSGYSEALDEFADGVPVIAIHGTNRPELMGQDRSNGCIRLPNDMISELAGEMALGTPIYIWP